MSQAGFYSVHEHWISVRVKAKPGARKDTLLGIRNGELVVEVRAIAEKGRANDEIARLLGRTLGVPRDSVVLKIGGASPHKIFRLPCGAEAALTAMARKGA
jgi:uncharacterized protein YggU (UPF0235/DUF167 family)